MNNETINGGALAVTLTCDQLRDMIRDTVVEVLASGATGRGRGGAAECETERFDSADWATGLRGISDMFQVTPQTAQKYKNTWLAPAVKQRGKKLFVNRKMAMELFEHRNNNQ